MEIFVSAQLDQWSPYAHMEEKLRAYPKLRLVVVSPDIASPDKIIPSTGTVSDFESSDALIEEADVTYVMDRGYPSRNNLMDWQKKEISFVVRMKNV